MKCSRECRRSDPNATHSDGVHPGGLLRPAFPLAPVILGASLCLSAFGLRSAPAPGDSTNQVRALRFSATSPQAARVWQRTARDQLFRLLMGGGQPQRVALNPEILQTGRDSSGAFTLEELTLQSLPDRRVHVWLAVPTMRSGKVGAVLALHGHGGTGEQVVKGRGLYWYGRALAEMGYLVIAPDLGSHELQHTNWALMGERTWDAIRCLDYLTTRPEVDPERLIVAGLSLGGETTMYVAALDERVRAADSSGWLTTVANMTNGHCPCWNFPGLEATFDFSDIFACVAPRPLLFEIGEKERAPGGFPVEIARPAYDEVRGAYEVFGAGDRVRLDVHPGGHVFRGAEFWGIARQALGPADPYFDSMEEDGSAGGEEAVLVRRGERARRCFARALGVLEGWWALRDRETGLFPRRVDQPVWAPQDNAADMLPFLFLTAHFLAPERLEELLQALRSERRLTSRIGPLPDWYALTNRGFVYPEPDLARILFNAAEYAKDGLVPMTEVLGPGPWVDRYRELVDAIFEHAPVVSDFGKLPADDAEVNGDVLQALARLYGLTRERKYLEWAERIVDAYCLEVLPRNGRLPPRRWDFRQHKVLDDHLNLNDHGNEILGGLAEWFVLTREFDPPKAERYREPLGEMFETLLDRARNDDGLWFNRVEASSANVLSPETPDTWGYALAAGLTYGKAAGQPTLTDAARTALLGLRRPRYLDWNGADAYADSIEGALLLLNRLPSRSGFLWLEQMLPLFLGKQQESGIVEGWYGDGNYARTALMAGLYYTQGTMAQPWRSDLQWSARRDGQRLRVVLTSPEDWQGRLRFDVPRHRLHVGLPVNYPRLNEFPEWFVVEPEDRYRAKVGREPVRRFRGADLAAGLPVTVPAGKRVAVEVWPDPAG